MEPNLYESAGSPSDQAIEWLARLRADDVTPQETADFAAWLAASTLNKIAFDEATELWHELHGLPHQSIANAEVLRPRRYQRTLPLAVAASLLVACVVLVMQLTTPSFTTGKGEQRRVVLADGTTAFLNTASEIRVNYSHDSRQIELQSGEVWFDVVQQVDRPFIVTGKYATAEAVGTAFTVRETRGFTSIGVTEGVVAVRSADAENPQMLRPGQQSTVSANVTDIQPYDADTALAWQRGEFKYVNVRLDDVLADLSRYLPKTMTLNDQALAGERIDVFLYLEDQDAMLEALREALPIRWKSVSDSLIIITADR